MNCRQGDIAYIKSCGIPAQASNTGKVVEIIRYATEVVGHHGYQDWWVIRCQSSLIGPGGICQPGDEAAAPDVYLRPIAGPGREDLVERTSKLPIEVVAPWIAQPIEIGLT